MKKFTVRAFLMAAVILVSTTNCGPPSSMLSTGSDLLTSLTKNPTLSKVAGLMKTPGLGQFLDATLGDKFTLFAPTNDALASMGEDMLGKLSNPANVVDLANVFKKHIVPGKVTAEDVKKGGLKTAGGTPLNVSGVNMGTVIGDKKFNIIPIDKVLK